MNRRPVFFVCALSAFAGLAFGAGDQYLGTVHVSQHFAASSTISALSAPWLLLPFLAGTTQRGARRAALVGLDVSLFAVAGYTAMILSPMEGAHPTGAFLATPLSQRLWFLAALVLLRIGRWWSSGDLAGYQIELAAAAGLLCYFAVMILRYSHSVRSASTTSSS